MLAINHLATGRAPSLLQAKSVGSPLLLASAIAAAVERMGWWSPFPAARLGRLPRAGVVASAHLTGLYPLCGPYPRREVSAVVAGSVRKVGAEAESASAAASVAPSGSIGATASVLPAAAPWSFAAEGGAKPWALRGWRDGVGNRF